MWWTHILPGAQLCNRNIGSELRTVDSLTCLNKHTHRILSYYLAYNNILHSVLSELLLTWSQNPPFRLPDFVWRQARRRFQIRRRRWQRGSCRWGRQPGTRASGDEPGRCWRAPPERSCSRRFQPEMWSIGMVKTVKAFIWSFSGLVEINLNFLDN